MKNKPLINLIKEYSLLSIIGMDKNVGKTTVLNYIINNLGKDKLPLGLTSIGRDGEDVDVVTNTSKPRIYVPYGSLIATARQCLNYGDITREILLTTGIHTSMGEVIILRALSDGYVDLGGPSLNSQMNEICLRLRDIGASLTIVDGALNRKTFASPTITEATILSTGASLDRDMNKVVNRTIFGAELLSISKVEDENIFTLCKSFNSCHRVTLIYKNKDFKHLDVRTSLDASKEIIDNFDSSISYIYVKGVISDMLLNDLIKECNVRNITIIADDGTKLFIKRETLSKLTIKGGVLRVLEPITLLCITCNPTSPYGYNFNRKDFIKALKENTSLPVFDVLGGD